MRQIRVLIADDHPLIRQGLVKVIGLDGGIRVVGEAVNGRDVVDKTAQLSPDVIILDLNMPEMDGLEAARVIKSRCPEARIIALTVDDSERRVIEVIKSGVSGYLLKDIEPEALASAIKAVFTGETVIHPRICSVLLRELDRLSGPESDCSEVAAAREGGEVIPGLISGADSLTPRETEILCCLADGEHNSQIAKRLFISEKTVKNHISSIFRKLQVEDRTQAVLSAIKLKLVKL